MLLEMRVLSCCVVVRIRRMLLSPCISYGVRFLYGAFHNVLRDYKYL
jgi:hypothetical protein